MAKAVQVRQTSFATSYAVKSTFSLSPRPTRYPNTARAFRSQEARIRYPAVQYRTEQVPDTVSLVPGGGVAYKFCLRTNYDPGGEHVRAERIKRGSQSPRTLRIDDWKRQLGLLLSSVATLVSFSRTQYWLLKAGKKPLQRYRTVVVFLFLRI
jgi:hypothetical protein